MPGTNEQTRGRPRSEHARKAILEATRDLLADGGWDSLSVEHIAARANVGKQTVYRWWPNKGAILSECIVKGYVAFTDPIPRSGNWREDIVTAMNNLFDSFTDPAQCALTKALIVAAAADAQVASQQYEMLTSHLHDELVARFKQGIAEGQIKEDADVDTAVAMLIGTPLYWMLTTGPAEASRSTQVLRLVLESISQQPPRLPASSAVAHQKASSPTPTPTPTPR